MLVGFSMTAFVVQCLYAVGYININSFLARGLASVPMFCWGIFLFKNRGVKDLWKWNVIWIVLIIATAYLFVGGIRLHFFWMTDITTPFCIVALSWLATKNNHKLNSIIDKLGGHSLEIYVANITALRLIKAISASIFEELAIYVVGTVVLSIVCISTNSKVQHCIR